MLSEEVRCYAVLMGRNKILLVIPIIILLLAGFIFWQQNKGVATYEDYQDCVNAGGGTAESDPPTCFHPNGTKITPGHKINN